MKHPGSVGCGQPLVRSRRLNRGSPRWREWGRAPVSPQPCVLPRGSTAGIGAGAPVSAPFPPPAPWRTLAARSGGGAPLTLSARGSSSRPLPSRLPAPAGGQHTACNTDLCRLPQRRALEIGPFPPPARARSWPPPAAGASAVPPGRGRPAEEDHHPAPSLLLSRSPFCRMAGCVLQLLGFAAD